MGTTGRKKGRPRSQVFDEHGDLLPGLSFTPLKYQNGTPVHFRFYVTDTGKRLSGGLVKHLAKNLICQLSVAHGCLVKEPVRRTTPASPTERRKRAGGSGLLGSGPART